MKTPQLTQQDIIVKESYGYQTTGNKIYFYIMYAKFSLDTIKISQQIQTLIFPLDTTSFHSIKISSYFH